LLGRYGRFLDAPQSEFGKMPSEFARELSRSSQRGVQEIAHRVIEALRMPCTNPCKRTQPVSPLNALSDGVGE